MVCEVRVSLSSIPSDTLVYGAWFGALSQHGKSILAVRR